MLWTREALLDLKEDDLTRDVLVPLFDAMGYRDVRFSGGQILEQGKDLTMWRADEFHGRVNIAAVVKSTKIGGDTTTGTVITQLRQAFAAQFRDTVSGAMQRVHEALVITPREVPKEGAFTLHNLLEGEPFQRYVSIIDGQKLWSLVTQHLGPRAMFGSIVSNYKRLNSRPDVRLGISLEDNETRITVRSRSGEPLETAPLMFLDTEDGRKARAAYERFIRTGEKTTIETAHFRGGLPVDELLATLGASYEGGFVTLTSTVGPMKGTLRARTASGNVIDIPHVTFVGHSGVEQLTLRSAEDQLAPVSISLNVRLIEPVTADFNLHLNKDAATFYWYLLALNFMRAAKRGATLHFEDSRTGVEYRLGSVSQSAESGASATEMKLLKRVVAVQQKTQQPVFLPKRPFFTSQDIEDLELVERVLATGEHDATSASFVLVPADRDESSWRSTFTSEPTAMKATLPNRDVLLLDNVISLGPAEMIAEKARVVVDDVEAAVSALSAGEGVKVRIDPVGSELRLIFLAWRKDKNGSRRGRKVEA